jgi:hypothetical protein
MYQVFFLRRIRKIKFIMNGRTYPPETLKKAIKEYMLKLTKLQRKEKLKKLNKING